MQHLGEFLKTERERKGIRLSDIASVTKIQLHNLKLIEEGNWQALPAKPFVKGFLTSYAKYVGLNSAEVYQRYLEETQPQISPLVSTDDESAEVSKSPLSEVVSKPKVLQLKPILISLGAVFVLVGSIWLIRIGKEGSESSMGPVASNEQTQSVPEAIEPSPAPPAEVPRDIASAPELAPAAAPTPEPTPSTSAAVTGHELEVNPKERTWVKIVIDDAPPVNLHLNPQEKTKFSAKEKIKLVLGNSAGSEVHYNGTLTEGKKYSGTIRYYIFPAGSKFPQDKPRQITGQSANGQESAMPPETVTENNAESLPELNQD